MPGLANFQFEERQSVVNKSVTHVNCRQNIVLLLFWFCKTLNKVGTEKKYII